ncbi:MAG: hypothetical protein GY679_01790 [Mycoplasma sp.]|nr:hypothetical protein [Mycoplasma sp.]
MLKLADHKIKIEHRMYQAYYKDLKEPRISIDTNLVIKNEIIIIVYTYIKNFSNVLIIDVETKQRAIKRLKLPFRKIKSEKWFVDQETTQSGYCKKRTKLKQIELGTKNVLIVLREIKSEWMKRGYKIDTLSFGRATGGSKLNEYREIKI